MLNLLFFGDFQSQKEAISLKKKCWLLLLCNFGSPFCTCIPVIQNDAIKMAKFKHVNYATIQIQKTMNEETGPNNLHGHDTSNY